MSECKDCSLSDDDTYLAKCCICHQMVCEEHKYTRSGRAFCSVHCADSFFHYDEDDADDD